MSKETAFHPRMKALTDEWMDLFGYWAPVHRDRHARGVPCGARDGGADGLHGRAFELHEWAQSAESATLPPEPPSSVNRAAVSEIGWC
jgi:hypothetical protein